MPTKDDEAEYDFNHDEVDDCEDDDGDKTDDRTTDDDNEDTDDDDKYDKRTTNCCSNIRWRTPSVMASLQQTNSAENSLIGHLIGAYRTSIDCTRATKTTTARPTFCTANHTS